MDEWLQIQWLRGHLEEHPRVAVGVGDDAAVVRLDGEELLMAVDMLLEGVHFDLGECAPRDVGRKAMNVNLSDFAAMAGRPTAAVVAAGLPEGASDDVAQELFSGLLEAAAEFDVAIVGGDTNRSRGGLVVSVTLVGHATGKGPVLRSGAKPGDALCVTGALGYSGEGRHLTFRPRVEEAIALHAGYELHAMIDLSDGLAADLFHVTDESGCGAIIDAERLPIRTPTGGCNDGRSPIEHALNDGEDFELLFAMPAGDAGRLLREPPFADRGTAVARIGRITAESDVLIRRAGEARPLIRGGFTHRW